MGPLLAGGGDDVDVAVKEEGRAAVGPGEAGDEVRPLGLSRVERALDPRRGQQLADVLDALALGAGRVGRVEAKQVAQQLDRIWKGYSDASASSSRSTSACVL